MLPLLPGIDDLVVAQKRGNPPVGRVLSAEAGIWTQDSLIFSQVLYQAELPRRVYILKPVGQIVKFP